MKFINIESKGQSDLPLNHPGRWENTHLECEPGKWQTIRVKLPNRKIVTFTFVPGLGEKMEFVEIHATIGRKFKYQKSNDHFHFEQYAVGYSGTGDTFDTRKLSRPTCLISLLLNQTSRP